ncbi:MAG: tRNA (adenosine(37)-N6)-threonylcarbamoyltransferase complex dimerization subunit type 1 TsaB [Prevotellaceae bacterium]|nr:tRNA (adenosine(37)-N6)-threonylcarbamoyltransferase complex dimerization subunit type 1 TsaB [Prevotellaceae bacterium]
MSCILHIETSTNVCSVAVSHDGECIYHKEDFSGPNHASTLGGYVDEAISFTDSHAIPFDAVAVSCGPGSYTGLRIGVSLAKGVCYGRQLKLISVPTLDLMCVPLLLGEKVPEDALLCPMLDARRMEVYAEIVDRGLRKVRGIEAEVINEDSYKEYLEKGKVCFFGNGSDKCKEVIKHENAIFLPDVYPLAKYMMPLAERKYFNEEFEDVAYFEPFYLKDFVALKPKNQLKKD